MEKEIKEQALDLVEDLNNEIYERGGMEWYLPFEFSSYGHSAACIKFMGLVLWTEDNDEREWIADGDDEKEPLDKFIKREAMRIMADLNNKMSVFY